MPPTKEAVLVALLIGCFDEAEKLRHFVRFGPHGARLAPELPGGRVSVTEYAHELVAQLQRTGYIGGWLFDGLVAEFRPKEEEIERVRAMFGFPRGEALSKPETVTLPTLPTVVILTALPVEYDAVRAQLADPKPEPHARGTIYEVGGFPREAPTFRVAIAQVGARNANAAAAVERAIAHHEPKYVLFVGVAGGLKDVALGDVVLANKVYGYQGGKDTRDGFLPRPVAFNPSAVLLGQARFDALAWNRGDFGAVGFHVYEGAIAAGDVVVTSIRSDTARRIRAFYGDALAVDMEDVGFLEAAHANTVEALVVRGISDLLEGKQAADASGSQARASGNATAVAFRVLQGIAARR